MMSHVALLTSVSRHVATVRKRLKEPLWTPGVAGLIAFPARSPAEREDADRLCK